MKTRFEGFESLLAQDIQAYLQHKRALGRKFDTEERALQLLDRYFTAHPVSDVSQITSQMIDAFLLSRPRHRPRSYNHLLGVIRCFFHWLCIQERLPHSPVHAKPQSARSQQTPFLFSVEQIHQLLSLAAQLPDNPRALHRSEIYSLIFALMYGLGLRVGEVSRLCHQDIDLQRQLLVIRETKFGKSRLVPFGPKLAKRIEAYLEQRVLWQSQWHLHDPLFSFSDSHKKPIHPGTIIQTFHHLIAQLKLNIPPGVAAPHLHCLRHSFAVSTLLHWYRQGINPSQRLFHLSTFMGHVDPSSTAWYITITDELLQTASRRFENMAPSMRQGEVL